VHATHATPAELQGVQGKGASIVICPATEANLGDGVFDLPAYAAAGGKWSIGSDSHVTRSWPEELRLLEYSQRLTLRQRNIAARILGHESSAAGLFEAALAGGFPATGQMQGGLAPGHRADFVTVDMESPALLGVPPSHVLDALVFSSPGAAFGDVFVAGQRVAASSPQRTEAFGRAMQTLWKV
jgi:formimidoylglutamate deiminase